MLELSTEAPKGWDKKVIKKENKEIISEIERLQRILYAEQEKSVLIVLQGIDASGKDGTVRTIFSGINPLGCNVFAFKKPTEQEQNHDFLWRIHKVTPAKGMIHIFNRSHYEDILVPSVMGTYNMETVDIRYNQINQFEKLLESCGTKILKFYLHISKEEQLERLIERKENPEKHWKHNQGDWDARNRWDDYMEVYEKIFEKCNDIPWHIVPSDNNWVKINFIAKEIYNCLNQMNLQWPDLPLD